MCISAEKLCERLRSQPDISFEKLLIVAEHPDVRALLKELVPHRVKRQIVRRFMNPPVT